MNITKANYLISNSQWTKCPKPDRPEIAFIGRSNVGKSSLINMLAQKKGLAKTSSTPGKTQLINHFNINDSMYWVDLPGYGYAKVSKKQRGSWMKMIWNYLEERPNLVNLFVLIDSRHKPQKVDLEFINLLGQKEVPFSIVFTKTDKSKQRDVQLNINAFKKELLNWWEDLPMIFRTSAMKGLGRKEMLAYVEENIL